MPSIPWADEHGPDWGGHLTVLTVNAALGGLTGGLRRHAGGGSFWRGFAEGATGGAVVYGGKLLSTESFWGAGMLGRQVGAMGASVIRNTSEGRPPLQQLLLPWGPTRLHLDLGTTKEVRVKLDLLGTTAFAYRMLSTANEFDRSASLSAGTPVFLTQTAPHPGWHGNHVAGVILLLDEDANGAYMDRDRVFAHERVHLIQYDQAQHTWGAPFESWLLRKIPGGAWIERHVELGLLMVPVVLLNQIVAYEDRPWEREAHFFSGPTHGHLSGPRLHR